MNPLSINVHGSNRVRNRFASTPYDTIGDVSHRIAEGQ